jgi:hypothetical protein
LYTKPVSYYESGDNAVFIEEEARTITMVLNGRNSTKNPVVMEGQRCNGPCLPPVEAVPTMNYSVGEGLLWSDPKSWPSERLPKEGDDITVNETMVFDLEESPIYRKIEVNGRLVFKEDEPVLHLRAFYIFVRAGEFLIGNATDPYKGFAKITLYGNHDNVSLTFTKDIEGGNKILLNTATLRFYGLPRAPHSRLTATAKVGDTQIFVAPGLDWRGSGTKKGAINDQIVLVSTSMMYFENEKFNITSYDD